MSEPGPHGFREAKTIYEVLITDELARRPSRPPDHAAELRALLTLTDELKDNASGVLQKVAELVVELCHADSAGISILEPGGEHGIFRWHAAAGSFAPNLYGSIPREFSPCGTVIQHNRVLLFREPHRFYEPLRTVEPRIYETLLAPWEHQGRPFGTVWAISHHPSQRFESEDARLLTSIARFAATAWALVERTRVAESFRARQVAALNLMEDAIASHEQAERASAALRANEERLRLALSIETVGVVFFRLDGEIVEANATFQRMSGYSAAELRTLPWMSLTPPEFQPVAGQAARNLAGEGRTPPYEKQLLRKDGARWWGLFAPTRVSGTEANALCVEFVIDISGTRAIQQALRESEDRLRTLADAVPQIIWSNSAGGAADYFNRRWYEYTGLSLEQSAGPGWQAIVHPEDASTSVASWRQAQAAGAVFACELRLRGADGRYRWFIGRNVPVRNEAGEVMSWFGTATDIHDLKEAEAAVREREEQFRRAIEDAPIPVIMHAEDGQVLQISNTWTELTGFTREDIPTFEAWLNRAYGGGAEAVRALMHQLFQGSTRVVDLELEVATRTGQRRHWSFSASVPGVLRDGRRYIVGMALDITERKQAEDALRQSQERLRLIVENAREYAIFSLDLDRRVTSWNAGAQSILGYLPEEIIGQSGDVIFTPEDQANGAPAQEAGTALASGRAADERWHLRKDGAVFWGSGVMTAMHGTGGEALGFVKIFRDQTRELRAIEALEQSRAELWAALQETERARAEAEAAGQAKDHFIAVLSHELRTPLTPVLMATHALARRRDLPAKVHEALEMIRRNIQLEAHLVDDLLDVTRIARGKMELIRAPMDLHEAVKRAVEVSQPDLDAKQQRLKIMLGAQEHALSGDLPRLQQVIWNLLKNASKFTPRGGEIRLSTRHEPGRVLVEIADTGIGIEAEALPRIFEAFTQADRSITQEFGGLGLGLAIARATVLAHEGELTATSAGRGQGATFTVSLPLP